MASITQCKSSHAVCIPFPAQGHINPMLKLAKLLHNKGFHITFVHTEYNYKRLLKSGGPDSVKGLPDFRFTTIPDGLSHSDPAEATQDVIALCDSTSKNCLVPFRDLIANLNSASNLPQVTCIVSDGAMAFTLQVAEEVGVPEVMLWTTSACGFMGYLQLPHLIEKGLIPLKEESQLTNEYLETPVEINHGIMGIRLRDLPSFIRTTDTKDIMLNYLLGLVKSFPRASAMILNTFDEFEQEVLSAIKSNLPPIYTLGPLHLLTNQVSNIGLDSLESNLWKEEPECLEWLDSKAPSSVVYVNFGSLVVITPHQMIEFAWGLANSKHTFLWVIRPDLVTGDSAILPQEFVAEIGGRGLLAKWCPQEQLLKHPSIGGFLTHCGWNSVLESVCSAVPMICWPFFAEQQMNCRFSCTHWGIGMEIDSNVNREEVESLVREMMDGEKGKEMKKNALDWRRKAEKAVAPGGSSAMNISSVIKEIMQRNEM